MFRERLNAAARVNDSWLMIGLDPLLDRLPEGISRDSLGIEEFIRQIVDATKDLVIGYKPNFAFYEVLGSQGWDVLARTRDLIPSNLIALADAKRGDIGDTAELYAQSIFDLLRFDAATVSPYTGREGAQPFLGRTDRGVFVLCRTSNRDRTVQCVETAAGEAVWQEVAKCAPSWGDNVGLVLGATDLGSLQAARELAPETPFLVPGVGAQGASAAEAIRAGADERGELAIIPISRSIIYASGGRDFAEAARTATIGILNDMRAGLRMPS